MSTYEPIASQTLSSTTTSVTFSSLPQNYTDLILIINGGHNSGSGFGLNVQFNSDVSSNYSSTVMRGNGSVADSFRYTSQTAMTLGIAGLNNLNNSTIIQIQNYSNSATNKTVLSRNNGATETWAVVGLWRNTSPINSLRIFPETASWLSGTTFSIYGIAQGNSSAKASGGNIVTTDGSFWYHAFTSSGTFIPNEPLTADVLVVAGGGGGGYGNGGGGGAGGLLGFTAQSLLSSTVYTCVVGAGGVSDLQGQSINIGTNGGDSKFGSLTTVIGGGRGGSQGTLSVATGANGGSGGGGATGNGNTLSPAGSNTAGQGNVGGVQNSLNGGGGAGGGAVSAGGNGSNQTGGTGGAGSNAYSSWASATATGASGFYAGGGGGGGGFNGPGPGGPGGAGGGGAGSTGANVTPTAINMGVAGTGGGGGGGGGQNAVGNSRGGNGGSGLIIVRYAV